MRRIPASLKIKTPGVNSSPYPPGGGGGSGGGSGGTAVNPTTTVLGVSGLNFYGYEDDFTIIPGSSPVGVFTLDALENKTGEAGIALLLFRRILNAESSVIEAKISASINTGTGSVAIEAVNAQGVVVGTSPFQTLGANYPTIRWTHGLGPGLYLFQPKFRNDGDESIVYLYNESFWGFIGSGTVTTPTLPPGNNVELRSLYLSRYTHGSAQIIVDGTPIQDAIDSMSNAGGIILVKERTGTGSVNLYDPGRQDVAYQLLSSAENSSLDWRAQYVYLEDIGDGRGYTGGVGGFCSGTGDMIQVVDRYIELRPSGNPLQPYRAALAAVNGTDSHAGLGAPFESAWVTASSDEFFRQAQDELRQTLYFGPAVDLAISDGLGSLGQFCYFDHSILNGFDGMSEGIRQVVIDNGVLPPSQGGNETTYLNAWLQQAIVQMDTDPAHADHSRVIAQQKFLSEGKLNLELPLNWLTYGDSYSITSTSPPYSSGVGGSVVYDSFNFNNRNFTSYCSVMSYPGHTPQITGLTGDFESNERAVRITGSSKVGVFGLDISSTNTSGHPYADGVIIDTSTEVAIWSNTIHDCTSGVGVNGALGSGADKVDTCYNTVYNTSGWLDTMASAISYYQLKNVGGGDDGDGYSCRIIGNFCYNNLNDPSYGGAITDGNGIIIDITNGDYNAALTDYTGHVLVAFNICVANGGRGVHAFFSRNVHQYFNTSALNLRSASMLSAGEVTQYGNQTGAESKYNAILTRTDRNVWFVGAESTVTPEHNLIARGSSPAITGTNIDKTSVGEAYFTNPSILNFSRGNWAPVTPDYETVDADVRAALAVWPDGNLVVRQGGLWSIGAVHKAQSGGGGGGSGPDPGPGVPTPPVEPVIKPEDFGAVGDGVADDTSALQAAFDAVGSGTVLLTPGKVYNHSSVLSISSGNINGSGYRSGTSVVGAGRIHSTVQETSAVFFLNDASAYGVVFSSNATSRGVTFEMMKVILFTGNGNVLHEVEVDNSHAAGIFIEAASNYTIRRCIVKNNKADGIHSSGGANNGLITDPYLENVGDDGVAVVTYGGQSMCENIVVERPVVRGGNARGVTVVGGRNITFTDIDVADTKFAGIYLSCEREYNTEDTTNVTIDGGFIRGAANASGHPSILFYNSNGLIANCHISNLTVYDTAGSGNAHISAYASPITGCSVEHIRVSAAQRDYLVYDPESVLTVVDVGYI